MKIINCQKCNVEIIKTTCTKYCAACRLDATRESKSKYNKSPKGKAANRRYKQKQPRKQRAKMSEEERKLSRKKANDKYRLNPANKEKLRANKLDWYYTPNGQAYYRIADAKRRNPNAGKINIDLWQAKLKRLGNRCLWCNTTKNIEIDHIKPISKGGTNHIHNLQPLCRSCNSKKGAT